MTELDIDFVRSQFPAFAQPALRGQAFFENAQKHYMELQTIHEHLASILWPSMTEPLLSRDEMRGRLNDDGKRAWQSIVEEPLGQVIESKISSDLIRGLVFTDGKIGVSTYPHDPTLLQNRCFLYHVIGRGNGEWLVPQGGMGTLVDELVRVAQGTGKVTFATGATIHSLHPENKISSLAFDIDGKKSQVDAGFILCNASRLELDRMTGATANVVPIDEGAGFKINMLLERLPRLRSNRYSSAEAFAGTFHVHH